MMYIVCEMFIFHLSGQIDQSQNVVATFFDNYLIRDDNFVYH